MSRRLLIAAFLIATLAAFTAHRAPNQPPTKAVSSYSLEDFPRPAHRVSHSELIPITCGSMSCVKHFHVRHQTHKHGFSIGTVVATWYGLSPGDNHGSCYGGTRLDGLPYIAWDSSVPCGTHLRLTYHGRSVEGIRLDTCPCGHLDIAPSLFRQLAPLGTGVINVHVERI